MAHTLDRFVIVLACAVSLTACAMSHGRSVGGGGSGRGSSDAGLAFDDALPAPRPVDAGLGWTRCADALAHGHTDDACSFAGSCNNESPGECTCTLQATCSFDTLAIEDVCPPCRGGERTDPWTDCDAYRTGGGSPGDACDPSTFHTCSDGQGCCNSYVCDPATGTVQVRPALCDSICVPHMDTCPGTTPPPTPMNGFCRSTDECATAPICLPPGVTIDDCGPCQPPQHDCATDADCGAGDVCASVVRDCTCMDAPSTVCEPSCAAGGTPCADGETCNDAGVCVPILCDAGYTCGVNTICQVGASTADAHGCVHKTCAMDADCDCGPCVQGGCYGGLGACSYL